MKDGRKGGREGGTKRGKGGVRREGMTERNKEEEWRENEGYFYKKNHESY